MALPSKLTSPLNTATVDNPDVPAQLNIDYNTQVITNPGATATIDPTKGSLILINTSTVATTIALTTTPQGTMQTGQRVTVVLTSSGVSPTVAGGTGVHLAADTLVANKANVIELRYDPSVPELKQVAFSSLS